MKPDWDKLTKDFKDSKTAVIVDVDCTKDSNKDVCSKYGVRGYPTIKYFTGNTDPTGDAYEGGRSYDALKEWADENLGPSCGADNLDLCDDDDKAKLQEAMEMDPDDILAEIKELDGKASDAEKKFKKEVEKLQKKYEKLSKEKDDAVAATGPDLRLYRSVAAFLKKKN